MKITKAVRSVVEDALKAIVRELEDRQLLVARLGFHAVLMVLDFSRRS